MATDRTNRSVLTVVGLAVTGAGVCGLLAGYGVFGSDLADRPLFKNATGDFFGRNGTWLWPVIAVVLVLVGLLALLWLLRQLTPDRSGELDVERSDSGRTRMRASALTDGLLNEVDGYRGVRRSRAHLAGDSNDPTLVLQVTLADRADLPAVRDRLQDEAVAHARQAYGRDLPVRLLVDIENDDGDRTLR